MRPRKVWLSGVVVVVLIFVLRLRCRDCGRTSTVLPSFLHPRKRYGLLDIQAVLVERLVREASHRQVDRVVARGWNGPAQSTQRSWLLGFACQADRWLASATEWLSKRSGEMAVGRRVTGGGAAGLLSMGLQCVDWFREASGSAPCSQEDFLALLWLWGSSRVRTLLLAPTTRCREGP